MSTSLDEETTKKVIRQVEFYFSDSNLPRDNFLMQTISESEDGMVSLALICSFARMRGHLGLGDIKVDEVSDDTVRSVAEVLKSSNVVKLSEDGKKIGRTRKLLKPEEVIEQVDSRTIAASPLAFDVEAEEIEAYFNQLARVNSVRLPRHVADKRLFGGTALIEFSSEEEAENILKQSLTFGGFQLELKPKKDYDLEREQLVVEFENYRPEGNVKGKSDAKVEDKYQKGLLLAFTLKKKKAVENASEADKKIDSADDVSSIAEEKDVKMEKSAEEKDVRIEDHADMNVDNNSNGTAEEKNEGEVEEGKVDSSECPVPEGGEKKTEERTKAADFVKNLDVVMREDLKKVFQKHGTVKFIDFKIGEESGVIRFEDSSGSQKARAAAVLTEEGGLVVKNFIAVLEPLSGDKEKNYWSNIRGNQEKARDNKGGYRGRGGKFNRGGKNFRSRDKGNGNGRPNKAQKV